MARKKTVIARKPVKQKRTRKITEEQREALRERMKEMRKKRKNVYGKKEARPPLKPELLN